MPYAVVLDACVLAPYPLFDVLLRLADSGLYRPLWSERILDEVKRACTGKLGIAPERIEHRFAAMRTAFPDAVVTGYEPLVSAMTNHKTDRHVLATAVRANAAAIVTANVRDFPPGALEPFHIQAIHPDEFLLDQLDLNEGTTVDAMRRMWRANAHPPQTASELCSYLEPTAPRFGRQLAAALEAS